MSSPFTHEVLGEYRSEERWLKILPKKEAIRLLLYEGAAFIIALKLSPYGKIFVVIAVVLALYGAVITFLSLKKKSVVFYQKGGGSTYLNLLKRKRKHRKEKGVYALAVKHGKK